MWAYLPVGPLERQFEEGIQGGFVGRGPIKDLQEGVSTFLGWDVFGEASANYLLRCGIFGKVARGLT
jgi:hypothetical protein